MFSRLMRDNPLGLLMLCASLVGTGYLVVYRLDKMEAHDAAMVASLNHIADELDEFEDNITEDVANLESDVQTTVFALDSKFTDHVNLLENKMGERIASINTKVALMEKDIANASH